MVNLVSGDVVVDERGTIKFVNDFDFKNVKRFYEVENHHRGYIRAWHGHRHEHKYVYVSEGSILIGAVSLETEEVESFVLSSKKPRVLWIPPNHANGFMTLEEHTRVFFFSSYTLEESKGDDLRFPYDKWNIWNIEYR